MSPQSPMPEVKPEIVFIFELVQEVERGRLRIPNFQRPYVWRREQMRDLLDSVYRQYPIGSLLVWETDADLASTNWVGPVHIASSRTETSVFVLDGQQRLSTLVGVLRAPREDDPSFDDEDPGRWRVLFNAETGQFEHAIPGEGLAPSQFPMWKLMDTIEFLNECERMRASGGSSAQMYVQKTQDLLRTIQAYKLPLVRIRHTELNQAVDIFARLNSKGQAMTADQMVSALTYLEAPGGLPSFNLAKRIDDVQEDLDVVGFGGIDRTIILRAFLASLGEDIYRTDWTRLTDKKRNDLQEKLPQIIGSTRDSLLIATSFLHELGVCVDRLLPYSMQLVVLSAFFNNCHHPTIEQIEFLRKWFWASSFTNWFAARNPSRVSDLINEFRFNLPGTAAPIELQTMRLDERAQPLPRTFDMRAARARTLLLVLFAKQPRSIDGVILDRPWQFMSEFGPAAIGHIFSTVRDPQLARSPANRIIRLNPRDRAQARSWLIGLSDRTEIERNIILESHAIPPEAFPSLLEGDGDTFLRLRLHYLIRLECDFMAERSIPIPLDITPQYSPIDAG